jgi:hypothetical protein
MTTLWADSFEDTTAANLAYDYSNINSIDIVSGRREGTYAASQSGNNAGFKRRLASSIETIFVSFAFKPINNQPEGTFFRVMENDVYHVSLAQDRNGRLTVYRGDPKLLTGTLLGTSADTVLTVNQWRWLQIKIVIHDSTGSVEIRDASGAVLLDLTNQDTRNGGTSGVIDSVYMGCPSGTAQWGQYDDLHIWDANGSVCNTWTNDTRIDHLLPDGAGDSTQWTPSAGSNYECVNEAAVSTTEYVSSSTAAHKDLYAMSALPHTPANIFSVLTRAVATKDDAGARGVKLLLKSGTTTSTGATNTLELSAWLAFSAVAEADPNTSSAWTASGVNAAQVGVENV